MIKPVILCVDAPDGGLRVVFERRQGRYAHHIEWRGAAGEWMPLLESVEGGHEEIWPASPAIQEVHLEDRGDGSRVALCVGMAGKSHWSLAVKLAATGREAKFEVACRVRDLPESLRSTYRAIEPLSAERIRIAPLSMETSSPSVVSEANGRRIFSSATVAATAPQTVRWGYSISI